MSVKSVVRHSLPGNRVDISLYYVKYVYRGLADAIPDSLLPYNPRLS